MWGPNLAPGGTPNHTRALSAFPHAAALFLSFIAALGSIWAGMWFLHRDVRHPRALVTIEGGGCSGGPKLSVGRCLHWFYLDVFVTFCVAEK